MSVLVNRTSADEAGDPDLFGMWTGKLSFRCRRPETRRHAGSSRPGTSPHVGPSASPHAGGARGTAVPNTTARGYDFQDTSSAAHPWLFQLLAKAEHGGAAAGYEGAYVCVRAYGSQPIDFSLQAALTPCPSSYGPAGEPLMCSTPVGAPEGERRYAECTAAGECVCAGPWAKPVPTVFPGAGRAGGERRRPWTGC